MNYTSFGSKCIGNLLVVFTGKEQCTHKLLIASCHAFPPSPVKSAQLLNRPKNNRNFTVKV